ncbi:MAG TPA: PrsW family intramembrane metalloprotease [Solirubrobacterales bacterium]|nr:PrsW family intramembrane metalloprotease [Solirubrobacterales bacterium]
MNGASDSPNRDQMADQLQRRQETLEISGWGLPFRFFQPHNPCFWAFVALTIWGVIQMWEQWSHVNLGIATLASSVVLLALYGIVLGLVFLNIDRYDGQPFKLLAVAFIWGAVPAVFGMAIGANEALGQIYGKLFGQAFTTDWSAALSAPFVEETAKGIGFLLLLGLASRRIRSVSDALLVGAFIGLGFEILEDLLYTFNAAITASGSDQVGAAIQMVIVRSSSGIFSHALFTALFSAGLIYLVGTPALKRNAGRGILLMFVAVLSHGVWDGAAAIAGGGGGAVVVMAVIMIVGLCALVYAFRRAASRDREWIRDVLGPEVTSGNLRPEELDAAAGTHKQKVAFVKAPGGKKTRRGRRNRKRLVAACRNLSRQLARSRGEDSPGVESARERILSHRR